MTSKPTKEQLEKFDESRREARELVAESRGERPSAPAPQEWEKELRDLWFRNHGETDHMLSLLIAFIRAELQVARQEERNNTLKILNAFPDSPVIQQVIELMNQK